MIISTKLVRLIEENADQLTGRWLSRVRNHPGTPTYHTYDEAKLYQRAFSVYSQLGKWISSATTKEDIKSIYTDLGAQRYAEGFQLSEVIQALVITRRVLWFKVESEGFLDNAVDLNLALELNNHVIVFFDRATFYASVGYEAAALTDFRAAIDDEDQEKKCVS